MSNVGKTLLPIIALMKVLLPLFTSPLTTNVNSDLCKLVDNIDNSSGINGRLSEVLPFLKETTFSTISLKEVILEYSFSFVPILVNNLKFI